MEILRKYGVATNVYIPMIKAGARDFAVSADWTPAAGDVKISKDGGVAANITTLPVAITMGNGAMWNFALSATEMQAAKVSITVVDAVTKAVEDQMIMLATHGNASGEHAFDLDSTNLDAAISTRLASASYTAPDNAGIAAILDDTGTTGVVVAAASKTGYALSAAGVQAIWDALTTALTVVGSIGKRLADNVDAAISSRLATAGYTAPDNAGIAAILDDTGTSGVVVAAASKSGYALTVAEHAAVSDKVLGRSIAGGADGGRTVRDALRTLRNKSAISAGTLTVYQEDDLTPAFTAAVTTAAGDPISGIDPA